VTDYLNYAKTLKARGGWNWMVSHLYRSPKSFDWEGVGGMGNSIAKKIWTERKNLVMVNCWILSL
jgi:hypothetical protein